MAGLFGGYLTATGGGTGGGGSPTSGGLVVDNTYNAAEAISGGRPVSLTQSGTIWTAMASVSGRMPAIGIVASNYLSGAEVSLFIEGKITTTFLDFSGWPGQPVYVGASGDLSASGAPVASGNVQQLVGISINASGLDIHLGDPLEQVQVYSGDIGSGAVMGRAGGGEFMVASGSITTNDLGSGAIVSGLLGSGVIGRFHVASGQFAGFELGSGAIVSGRIASGQIGYGHFADNSVQSGTVASGALATYHYASGTTVRAAQFVSPVYSGTSWTVLTTETISGLRCVALNQSGLAQIAMAAVSGRMPSVGLCIDDVLSGIAINIYTDGVVAPTSGLFNGLGHFGQPVWVGRSGHPCPISGSFCSGGWASGDIGQRVGTTMAIDSGGILLRMQTVTWSGGPLGAATGGTF